MLRSDMGPADQLSNRARARAGRTELRYLLAACCVLPPKKGGRVSGRVKRMGKKCEPLMRSSRRCISHPTKIIFIQHLERGRLSSRAKGF